MSISPILFWGNYWKDIHLWLRESYVCSRGKSIEGQRPRHTSCLYLRCKVKMWKWCLLGKERSKILWNSKATFIKKIHGRMHPLSNDGFTLVHTFVFRQNSAPVASVMHNSKPHGTDFINPKGQVSIFTLPPNSTTIHQPIHLDIISVRKSHYRRLPAKEIAGSLEVQQARWDSSRALKTDMHGLDESHDPHLLDVLNWQR